MAKVVGMLTLELHRQVVHHPPITAVHVSTTDNAYTCEGEIEISSKFWGQFLEVVPLGLVQTKFPKHGDHYVWNKVATGVHNVLIGTMWLDQHGELVVKNLSTGDTSRTKFLKPSGKENSAISGKVRVWPAAFWKRKERLCLEASGQSVNGLKFVHESVSANLTLLSQQVEVDEAFEQFQ